MKNKRNGLMADINVTPLVDVMLVLLIIFMITAPLLSTGLEVDLPKTKAGELDQKKEALLIVINEKGEIFIDKKKIGEKELSRFLEQARRAGLTKDVNIKADKRCPYGLVAKVLAEVKKAGFESVGLITRPEET
ncbi:protein TolR [Thermodesulfatator indicus DSM 15286]|uniref:Protein TolR n=1 Tax=Thermodesulfatator indicus (strain DSM 15286 / JCM 11887 / CIR29812) TaxID=667014 RepID=F8AAB4_THEID|nr:protein TolR [Thermodesulfatator indicus]AEH44250.1 protein TolR [Thermodesulfatator indicus DSM 15286]